MQPCGGGARLSDVIESADRRSPVAAWVTAGILTAVVAAAAVVAVSAAREHHAGPAHMGIAAPASPSASPSASASPPAGADLVPWLDEPGSPPPPMSPLPTPTPPAPAYPACTAAQLIAEPGQGGGATGNDITVIALHNVGKSNCSLFGYPTSLVGVRADGSKVTLHPGHRGMFSEFYTWPADLKPGGIGHVGIMFWMGCDAAQSPGADKLTSFTSAILGLPGGGTVMAPAAFTTTCGISVTTFGGPPPPPPMVEGPYPGLTAHADLPPTAVAGSTLDYTVTLTNTTDHDVVLDPCPVYEQGIYAAAAPISQPHYFQLSCEAVHVIAAHESVTYAMRIAVPNAPTGTFAKFVWQVEPPGRGPAAGGAVTIVDASTPPS